MKIDAQSLKREKARFFVETRGAVYLPMAGSIYWLALAIAGYFLPGRTWCLVVLTATGLAFLLGLFVARPIVAKLSLKSPLASLFLPALLPVALSYGITIPAFYTEISLVPLTWAIGLASHWPAFGWIYGNSTYIVHAVVRTVLAAGIWFLLPEGRFTLLPLAISLVYVATSVWQVRELRRLEAAQAP